MIMSQCKPACMRRLLIPMAAKNVIIYNDMAMGCIQAALFTLKVLLFIQLVHLYVIWPKKPSLLIM